MSNEHGATYWCGQYRQLEAQSKAKILELEQRVKVLAGFVIELAEAVDNARDDIGGSRPQLDILRDAVAVAQQTPQQTAAQIERWHIEWMMKLPVAGHRYSGDAIGHYGEALYAIPPLPKESK